MGYQRGSNKSGSDENRNSRIDSEVIIDRNSLIISQNFCINATVGGQQKLVIERLPMPEDAELYTLDESTLFQEETETEIEVEKTEKVTINYTLIYSAPTEPIRAALLMTVIARNLSENDILVSIEDTDETVMEEVVPAKSELAMTVQNATNVRALALDASRVQFYISAYYTTNPI